MAASPAALVEPISGSGAMMGATDGTGGSAALSAIPKATPVHSETPPAEDITAANLDPQPTRSFQITPITFTDLDSGSMLELQSLCHVPHDIFIERFRLINLRSFIFLLPCGSFACKWSST